MSSIQNLQRRSRRHERGVVLVLWGLAWSTVLMIMIVAYHPLLRTLYHNAAQSHNHTAARNIADAAANDALWYAQYGLISLAVNSFGCTTPWSQTCLDKGAPIACPLASDGFPNQCSIGDVLAAIQFPFHATRGWTPQAGGTTSVDTTKTGSLTAFVGSNKTVGAYTVTVNRRHLPQPWIIARGCVPEGCDPSQSGRNRKTTRVVLERVNPQAFYASFGRDRLILGNHIHVDSYDSGQLVGYGEPLPGGGSNNGSESLLGTNGVGAIPEVQLQGTDILVQGKLMVTPNTTVQVPFGTTITDYVVAGQIEQQDQSLPRVQVPGALSSLAVTTAPAAGWTGFSAWNGLGDFRCTGSCTCSTPVRVKSVYVTGTLNMAEGCQILVDRCAGGVCSSVPYTQTPGGAAVDTDGSGKLQKQTSADTTQIFIRDSKFNFDGGGLTWNPIVPTADRDTPQLQLFVTCGTPPCNNSTASAFAQRQPFYGVVYVEDGNLALQRASENGNSYIATYHGAFVSGKVLSLNTVATSLTVSVHWDERAGSVNLDGTNTSYGSGDPYYRILSWQTD